ncbi:MAG TPA: ABC transporter [Sphingobium sp.]|uniref:ABC-type transport auxiliary lipoprotein family protein n=1 Tax=unclassified Sphingobium TaxID=2611147 RepID=UPI0007F3CB72|nr:MULTISPECIES: ABC-type transport auxiliary lipoprotein family protein [unclassified Sphingobium]OAN50942.1 ABC transporter [Sphingobium sp. TCM1]WIW87990.1 ABC-type transport auxiliary lipoprotein family protein [Sphingobium sp. V4]HAF41123.1 ABC transporter [Sphingobium sp.]
MFHVKQQGALAALAAAVLLSGCVSFGAKPPAQLLTLDAAQKVPAGAARVAGSGRTLIVADPEAPKMLDTIRVPVQMTPTSVAYVTKVQWADTPRHLFRRLMAETISATTDRVVLDSGQFSGDGGQRLSGELVAFTIDQASHNAIVTYDAVLTTPAGVALARQRFTASAPVSGKIEATTVGAPLNTAANKVATDVAAWVAAVKE